MPWSETTSKQVLVLSQLRTEGERSEMAVNPWVRESHSFHRLEPSHAPVCTQASDESARNSRLMHFLGLNQLRNRSKSCLGCPPRENRPKRPGINGSVDSPAFQLLEPSHATVCTQASDQNSRDTRRIHFLGLNQFRNRSSSCLGCAPRAK